MNVLMEELSAVTGINLDRLQSGHTDYASETVGYVGMALHVYFGVDIKTYKAGKSVALILHRRNGDNIDGSTDGLDMHRIEIRCGPKPETYAVEAVTTKYRPENEGVLAESLRAEDTVTRQFVLSAKELKKYTKGEICTSPAGRIKGRILGKLPAYAALAA